MGTHLTAAEAAQVAGVSERSVRAWISTGRLQAEKAEAAGPARWAIDVDDLAGLPGVVINREALARIEAGDANSAQGILARLTALELEVQALRSRLRTIEASGVPVTQAPIRVTQETPRRPPEVAGEASRGTDTPIRPLAPSDLPLKQLGGHPGRGATFRNHAEAGRWLSEHGINERTPKSWPGWRETPLDKWSMLNKALAQMNLSDWRITWRLHRCGDPLCVCGEALPPN